MRKKGGDSGEFMEQVSAYHKELQVCLREHETKFDNAVLLVAGGAFTIPAAFISDLSTPLNARLWLAVSWSSWGLCLLVGVGGHLVGAHATKRVLDLLHSQVYDFKFLMSGNAAKLIKPLNLSTFALLIVGFVAFGRFTFSNLEFEGPREKKQEDVKQESLQEDGRQADHRAQYSSDRSTTTAPQKNIPQVRQNDGRQETATATDAAAATAPNSEVRPGPADAGQTQGSHGAIPADWVAPAKEIARQTVDGS